MIRIDQATARPHRLRYESGVMFTGLTADQRASLERLLAGVAEGRLAETGRDP